MARRIIANERLSARDPFAAAYRVDCPPLFHEATDEKTAVNQWQRDNRKKRRSGEVAAMIGRIDQSTDALLNKKLADDLHDTYATCDCGELIGLFARCYLGGTFIDHLIDVRARSVTHFHRGEPVPSGYEEARRLAINPAYEYIEVYSDGAVIPVAANGEPR